MLLRRELGLGPHSQDNDTAAAEAYLAALPPTAPPWVPGTMRPHLMRLARQTGDSGSLEHKEQTLGDK